MTEHWIDRLSHRLARGASRRQAVGLAALLAAGMTRGGALEVEAGKKKPKKGKGKKGKDKRKGKGNGQKRPGHLGPPDGQDDCEAYLDAELWSDCREIRRTCHAPDQFCIHGVDGPIGGDDGEGASCCPRHKTCCINGCQNTQNDNGNCGGCGVACPFGQQCINGACRCEEGQACGDTCCNGPYAQDCCDGLCVDADNDHYNCGGCGVVCPPGQRCSDGMCRCEEGYQFCGDAGFCIPEGNACCGMFEYEGCHPTLPCCGSGISAYCGKFGYCP